VFAAMVKWDDSAPGFVGDDNLYGLGECFPLLEIEFERAWLGS
jgi:hypothetical protein